MEPYKTILRERARLMRRAEKELFNLVSNQQKTLLRRVISRMRNALSIRGGVIQQRADYDDILRSSYFQTIYEQLFGKPVSRLFEQKLEELFGLNAQYFQRYFEGAADIASIVEGKFTQVSSDFLRAYRQNQTVGQEIKRIVLSAIQKGVGFDELKKDLTFAILGAPDRYGIAENYIFFRTRLQDTFAEYDRSVQNEYAQRLSLNYAIYAGGEIETTRTFCEDRNNEVFKREEMLAWNNQNWDGKIEGSNVLLTLGGYNCRHFLNWISYELAERLRPGIGRSIFDTQIVN